MRKVAKKGLVTIAAASGVLAVTGGYAQADSGAAGSARNSPGVLSGNLVQVPVEAPVNVCGNTVNVLGVLNPSVGNACANGAGDQQGQGGSGAEGSTGDSPGVGSGNTVQVPVEAPVNVCGNSVDVGGAANPAAGNGCGNQSDPQTPQTPEEPENPAPENPEPVAPEPVAPGGHEKPDAPMEPQGPPEPQAVDAPAGRASLAETGAEDMLDTALPVSAALLLGGAMLYRRARAASRS